MNSPINVTITGAAGRMGKRLVSLVNESARLQLAGATEAEGHPALGKDAGNVAGCGPLGVSLTDDLAQALPLSDVVIDFTSPAATLHHLSQSRPTQTCHGHRHHGVVSR